MGRREGKHMSSNKRTTSRQKQEKETAVRKQLIQTVLYSYIFLMVLIHPIIYQNHFFGMVIAKTNLFWYSTMIMFAVIILIQLLFFKDVFSGVKIKDVISKWSKTDWFVGVFFITVLISWILSDYQKEALWGADGWFVGSATLLLCCVAYYYISRYYKISQTILWCMLGVNFFVFIVGILNHFHVDPLGMFTMLDEENSRIFITTIGNINLYSSYLCFVVPIFMGLFCVCKTRNSLLLYGTILVFGFMSVIIVNSDSVFLGIGAAFIFLLWYGRDNWSLFKRYLAMVLIFLLSIQSVGLMRFLFKEDAMPLSSLSNFFSSSRYVTVLIPIVVLIFALSHWMDKKKVRAIILKRLIVGVYIAGCTLLVAFIVLLIWINSRDASELSVWMQSMKLDDSWGSSRGFIWRSCMEAYEKFPFLKKLFGCGPDALSYFMMDTYYTQMIAKMNAVFSNAHNEFIQILLTLGLFGCISYFGMLISGAIRFMKGSRKTPFLLAVSAMIISYLAQGIVNNPQYITTPLLFIFIGIGEAMTRNEDVN